MDPKSAESKLKRDAIYSRTYYRKRTDAKKSEESAPKSEESAPIKVPLPSKLFKLRGGPPEGGVNTEITCK